MKKVPCFRGNCALAGTQSDEQKREQIEKYGVLGLDALASASPLPGTGAWTGQRWWHPCST
ncbi:MAG: hypothetical protein ACLR8P_07370 [Clostridium fessum]